MKRAIKREWVKALKSGDYKQGKCALVDKTGKKYCCLGVLACLTGASNKDIRKMRDRGGDKNGFLPMDLATSLGLEYETMESLASMNDADSQSFEDIADYISKNL